MSRPAPVLTGILLLCACQPDTSVGPPSQPNRPPTAQVAAPALGREGSSIPFSAERASDPDGDELIFIWGFGDGATLVTSDRSVDHIYRNNGSYSATLIVSDAHGAADTVATLVTIANVEPQITLLRIPDTVVAGALVEIEVQYADPGLDDTVRAAIWIFRRSGNGGGSGIDGPGVVVRRFSDPDEYTISVSAEDNDGARTSRAADHPLVVIAPAALRSSKGGGRGP